MQIGDKMRKRAGNAVRIRCNKIFLSIALNLTLG